MYFTVRAGTEEDSVEGQFESVMHCLTISENLPVDNSTAEYILLFYTINYISKNVTVFPEFFRQINFHILMRFGARGSVVG
jgi:hypothetical protein